MTTDQTSSLSPVRIGLLGLGTVGGGTYTVLKRNHAEITRRALRPIEVAACADVDLGRARALVGDDPVRITDDALSIIDDDSIDIVVELIGGTKIAKDLVLAAIERGKHVVTANKALLALHGNEIFQKARQKGVIVAFEAAVAGGIPIIRALREGLTANRIDSIAGIVNGTCNYILTEMREKGLSFTEALADAQRLGYAEADPAFDIGGIDAAHKLTIMSALAFGSPISFDKAYIEGISSLTPEDIQYADEFGYRIKLLAITRRTAEGIELRVHPTLIAKKELIAHVEGVMNAVIVSGDAVGQTLYCGAGAGAEPTASSVVADLVDMTRMLSVDATYRVPYLAFQPDQLERLPILPIEKAVTSYYLRMHVVDRPGVLADVARILADNSISIEAVIQKEATPGKTRTDLIFLTHRTVEASILAARTAIEELSTIIGSIRLIRMENLSR